MTVITRFAPSPTGKLHVGNLRIAIINYLITKKHSGKFILRIDDTDIERSSLENINQIKDELNWLGLSWDSSFKQSDRIEHYNNIKSQLIKSGYLYPCYETQEELQIKRQLQIKQGLPPIYDRSGLYLSQKEKTSYEEEGRKPHYRFKIPNNEIIWNDIIKEKIHYHGKNLSDPILVREDGSFTYMLCSTIDDIDYNISHIIRGEDHISNTAIQIEIFKSLGAKIPSLGHVGLIKSTNSKISKRTGGFDIASLRNNEHLEPLTLINFFSQIGSSSNIQSYTTIKEIIKDFDIKKLSSNSIIFDITDLYNLNSHILSKTKYQNIKERIMEICNSQNVTEEFWLGCRNNIKKIEEIKIWWDICYNFKPTNIEKNEYLTLAKSLLPSEELNINSWKKWTNKIKQSTGRSGKNLYLPLRIALTGMKNGPELEQLIILIGKKEIIRRLT